MSKRLRWFLIIILGMMLHIQWLGFARANLSDVQDTLVVVTSVFPFGKLNYEQVAIFMGVEWWIVFILWIVFAVLLLREAPKENNY